MEGDAYLIPSVQLWALLDKEKLCKHELWFRLMTSSLTDTSMGTEMHFLFFIGCLLFIVW